MLSMSWEINFYCVNFTWPKCCFEVISEFSSIFKTDLVTEGCEDFGRVSYFFLRSMIVQFFSKNNYKTWMLKREILQQRFHQDDCINCVMFRLPVQESTQRLIPKVA